MSLQTFDDKKSLQMSELLAGLDANFKDLARVGTYVLTAIKKEGTNVYEITGLEVESVSSGIYSCVMNISNDSMDYEEGDSFKIYVKFNDADFSFDVEVKTSDGEPLDTGAFVKGAKVPVIIDIGEKTINFKLAGSKLKFLADSYLMVKCFTEDQTFTVPKTGAYCITCIGRGGYGCAKRQTFSIKDLPSHCVGIAGAGGGAGAAGSLTIKLKRGERYPVTVNNGIASFGTLITAVAGGDARMEEEKTSNYYTRCKSVPGIAGTIQQSDGIIIYEGRNGSGQDRARDMCQIGGTGGAYNMSDLNKYSKFLVDKDTQPGYFDEKKKSKFNFGDSPPITPSPAGLVPFGVGGSGQNYVAESQTGIEAPYSYYSGKGGDAAVIVEYIMDAFELPVVNLNNGIPVYVSKGESFTLWCDASSKNSDELYYYWYQNGKIVKEGKCPYLTAKAPSSTFEPVEYSVRVFDGYGNATEKITIHEKSRVKNLSKYKSYEWDEAPHKDYPDSTDNTKMTDDLTTTSANIFNSNKTYLVGHSSKQHQGLTLELDSNSNVKRICAHIASMETAGICFADSIKFYTSEDKLTWNEFGTWYYKGPSEEDINLAGVIVASVENELGVNAKYIKIEVIKKQDSAGNPRGWSMMAEVEVYGD